MAYQHTVENNNLDPYAECFHNQEIYKGMCKTSAKENICNMQYVIINNG